MKHITWLIVVIIIMIILLLFIIKLARRTAREREERERERPAQFKKKKKKSLLLPTKINFLFVVGGHLICLYVIQLLLLLRVNKGRIKFCEFIFTLLLSLLFALYFSSNKEERSSIND